MEFPKLGPLVEEKGLGWLFPTGTAIPANIQSQVIDWFYYRRICEADEDVFQRMFQRKERAVEARFLALMSAQAMEVDPLVQEMFEATVEATLNGKTIVSGTRSGTNSGTTTNNLTDTSNGETTGETSGKSDGNGSGTSSGTSKNTTSGSENFDGSTSDNNTHNAQQSDATSAYPESALSGATPGLPLPEEVTLSHLASLTISRNQTTDGRLGTNKHTNTTSGEDNGTTSATTENETHSTTSGTSSGTSKNTTTRTGTVEVSGSTSDTTENTTTNNGTDNRTSKNKGRHMSAQELLIKYMDFIYRCDAILWYVNELEDCFLSVYDDSGVDCFVFDSGGGGDGKDGKDGVTFVPHTQVLSDGVRIYWSNDGGLPNPTPVEIKNGEDGAPGLPGPAGDTGPEGPAGSNGANGVTFTPVVTGITGGYTLSWTNDGGLPNPTPVNIMNGTGGGGGGSLPAGGDASTVLAYGADNAGWAKLIGSPAMAVSGVVGHGNGKLSIGRINLAESNNVQISTIKGVKTDGFSYFGGEYSLTRYTTTSSLVYGNYCFKLTYTRDNTTVTESSSLCRVNTNGNIACASMRDIFFVFYADQKRVEVYHPTTVEVNTLYIHRQSQGISFERFADYNIIPQPATNNSLEVQNEIMCSETAGNGEVSNWDIGGTEKL